MLINLIANDNYLTVNKILVRHLGLEAAYFLCELANEYDFFEKENLLKEDYFFSTVENIEKNIFLSQYKQRKALKTLKAFGLIEEKVMGLPAKRYFKINEEQLFKILKDEYLTEEVLKEIEEKEQALDEEVEESAKEIINLENISELERKELLKKSERKEEQGEEEVKKNEPPKEYLTLFRNSEIFKLVTFDTTGNIVDITKLKEKFSTDEFKEIDLVYYFHAVADWSDSSNKKRTARGWLATIRNFMRKDKELGKLHRINDNAAKKEEFYQKVVKPGKLF